jgi:hypothetical protein
MNSSERLRLKRWSPKLMNFSFQIEGLLKDATGRQPNHVGLVAPKGRVERRAAVDALEHVNDYVGAGWALSGHARQRERSRADTAHSQIEA